MENRLKEQLMLFSDRPSTAYLRSNQIRLYFSSVAYLLMEALRRLGLRDGTDAGAVLHDSAEAAEDRGSDPSDGAQGVGVDGSRLPLRGAVGAGTCPASGGTVVGPKRGVPVPLRPRPKEGVVRPLRSPDSPRPRALLSRGHRDARRAASLQHQHEVCYIARREEHLQLLVRRQLAGGQGLLRCLPQGADRAASCHDLPRVAGRERGEIKPRVREVEQTVYSEKRRKSKRVYGQFPRWQELHPHESTPTDEQRTALVHRPVSSLSYCDLGCASLVSEGASLDILWSPR